LIADKIIRIASANEQEEKDRISFSGNLRYAAGKMMTGAFVFSFMVFKVLSNSLESIKLPPTRKASAPALAARR